jgi:DNA-binding MarR family transcriptional regulator
LSISTDSRLVNLFGVASLAAGDRMRAGVESTLGWGGAGPAALVHLAAHPGESAEALHRVLGISQPGTAQVVERLVDQGLLARRPGRDRRTQALHLTARGRRTVERLIERRAEALGTLLAPLTDDERAQLTPLLEKIVAGLADDRPEALRTCRLCDREACCREPGCPLGHTVRSSR